MGHHGCVLRWLVAVLLAVIGTFSASNARAGASVRLVYVRGPGAEQCPAEDAVRAAVQARLGYDPFSTGADDSLFAEVRRVDGVFHAKIKLLDGENRPRGERDLTVKGDDCTAVVDVMGLTISLTIDPTSLLGPTTPPPPPPPPPPPTTPPQSPPPDLAEEPEDSPFDRPASPPRPVARTVVWHVGVGAVGSLGAEPSPSAGAMLFVGASWRFLSLDLEGRADLPMAATSSSVPDAQVQSWIVTGAVVPCVHLAFAFGCPLLEIGSLQATSSGRPSPRTAQDLWIGAGGRLGVELPLGARWFVRLQGDVLGTIRRDALFVGGMQAYQYPIASGALGAGIAMRFP